MRLRKEILKAFRDELGWKLKRFNGEIYCFKFFPDRFLRIIPYLRNLDGKRVLDIPPAISTVEFSNILDKISFHKNPYGPLFTGFDIETIFYVPKFSLEDLRQIDEKLSSWALAQDLEKYLSYLRNLSMNDARDSQLKRHFAALILVGDVAKLKSYQAKFEVGDQLGFEKYITKVIALAEQQASNS